VLNMPSCREIDALVTPYVDGEATAGERAAVDAHLSACPPCRRRAEAEAAARETLRSRMCRPCAPEYLRKRCRKAATPIGRITSTYSISALSLVAVLVIVGGGVSVYALTRFSPTVLAAQLTLDHAKCFALHASRDPIDAKEAAVEFEHAHGWRLRLPQTPPADGLELVDVRQCFCGEGPAVHVMYRHQGRPLSLYVLHDITHAPASTGAFGHDAVMWSKAGSTYVLLGRESNAVLEHLAADLNEGL
jgi:anti-sigma factor (TIGR02949 family)